MTRREETIVGLLERWRELVGLDGPSGVKGDGELEPRMSVTYTRSVREVERLIVRLREERHSVWWHVHQRYVIGTSRTVWHCPRCKQDSQRASHTHQGKSGKPLEVPGKRQVRNVWHRNVDHAKVAAGVAWISAEWALPFEPQPVELQVDRKAA